MTLMLIETKMDCGQEMSVWQNEVGQIFTVVTGETRTSDFEDFEYLYAHRSEFKNLSSEELEDFYNALDEIERRK